MASVIDTIIADDSTQGYSTGSVADRERARLTVKTSTPVGKYSLADLYLLAGEPNRIAGKH